MCLNTDIARQFEFIQQTWLLNRGFATLHGETDPLLGPKGSFTIPAEPVRRRVEVESYVQMVGGEYFFLPSLPALDYLASLPAESGRDRRGGGSGAAPDPRRRQGPLGRVGTGARGGRLPGPAHASGRSSRIGDTALVTRYDDVREVFLDDAGFRCPTARSST